MDAENLTSLLTLVMKRLPSQHQVVVLDAITELATFSADRTMLGFFSSCRRLCSDGRTIILVVQSHAFDERMLVRLRDLCDAHLSLRVEKAGTLMGTTLEVRKAHGVDMNSGNTITFDVRPEIGINVLPIGKVKV